MENASVIFALNLYAFVTSNPVAMLLACGSIYPSLDFYYDGEYKTWWEQYGNWILFGIGVVAVIATCIICAPCGVAFVGAALAKIALGTAVNTVIGLAIGGTIAGIQAALTGHGFWDAFGDYVTENFVDELVMNFAFTSVSAAVGSLLGPKHCFAAGTLVATRAGLKPIEDIEVGDEVLAYDEETGEQAYKPVVQLFRNETKEWYHVRINDEEIICTGGHPFYILNAEVSRKSVLYEGIKTDKKGKWITTKELKVSDQVLLSDGSCAIIEEIQVEKLFEPETTYNFEVADFHTYYVSESNVLVHNACVARERRKAVREAWKQERELVAKTGQGTRNWSGKQRMELLKTGKVKGFEGHHINSVKGGEALAGNPDNIRFVTRAEHFALHSYNWKTATSGKLIDRMAMLNGSV